MSAADPSALDELYAARPDRFVELRDQLARELKAQGEAVRAAEVARLRRPTNAAHVVNRLALEHGGAIQRLLDAAEELRAAYEAGDGAAMRTATANERSAVADLLALAEREAERSGVASSATLWERVAETLQAVPRDEEVRDLVRYGRLDRERRVATLGMPLPGVRPSRQPAAADRGVELATTRKELARANRGLAAARKRAAAAADAADRAEKRLSEARERADEASVSVAELEAAVAELEDRVREIEDA